MIGGKGVGKTSLIRFLYGLPYDADIQQSHQITQSLITLRKGSQSQQFRIWDICGERNRSNLLHNRVVASMPYSSLYYSHSEIILLCYAINSIVRTVAVLSWVGIIRLRRRHLERHQAVHRE
mgnify:CR=1 FL=1